MNALQRIMIENAGKKLKEKGVTKTVINWDKETDDPDFFENLKAGEAMVFIPKTEYEFLIEFYNSKK